MNKAKQNYRKKTKRKYVDFYLMDKELYELACKINFQRFVKAWLKAELDSRKEGQSNGIVQD